MSETLYPVTDPKQNFAELEEKILRLWQEEKMFQQSLDKNKGQKDNHYVFFDGPPFANGLPHYGHLLTGYVKDLIPRYQTMKGKYVDRRFGWDCHGLPAEMDAQKHLNINGRASIISFGIDKFNGYCETAIQKYTKEWEAYVNRQARWVDFERAYKTMDLNFMESVIWAFSELYKKGWVYEGNRVMPYSWALETPLSNFETRLDNSYRMRQDPALSVLFELNAVEGETMPTKIVAWTTTPWTLPSNLGLAVGATIEYHIVEKDGVHYVIGKAAYQKYAAQFENGDVLKTVLGKDLAGRTYKPIFPYFENTPNAFKILTGDFVSTEDGTGIVHLAPGFGEEDQLLCAKHGIEPLCPVNSQGKFTAEIVDYEGLQVFEANKPIIAELKRMGIVLKHETINHNYPHCWRTDTPLIYKVQKSWYVQVTAFKDRMVELNKQINWIPFHVRDGMFGNWLEGAKDWSISRNRFWGTPIPIWKSDNPAYPRIDVYGSLVEIERDFGIQLTNLHRPNIDDLTRPNPDDPTGKSTMRRIEDVFDCWFESGSMSFAQNHYPFENKENFDTCFPADFIVEYVAQTRGWFYTMMVLSTALFDRPPFKNAICHGVIVDEDGEKLAKSKKNYPDPINVFNTYGSDTLRWFLMSSQVLKGGDLQIDREGKGISEAARKMVIPFWNAYSFFCLYANTDKIQAEFKTDSTNLLDKYILSKTAELVKLVTNSLDEYDIPKVCSHFEGYIEILNNWYIRRSRERFWRLEKDRDKIEAYNTIYTVLNTVSRLLAPCLPFISESVYKGLTKEKSVHLSNYPSVEDFNYDESLVKEMDMVIDICSSALSLRKKYTIRVRQPLSKLTIYMLDSDKIKPYTNIIRDELNVKSVEFTDTLSNIGSKEIVVNFKVVAPTIGKDFKTVLAAIKSGNWTINENDDLSVGNYIISKDNFEVKLVPTEGLTAKALDKTNGMVIIDTVISEELLEEGMVRDFVRFVQNARKDLKLNMGDKIGIGISTDKELATILLKNADFIQAQTLSEVLFEQSIFEKDAVVHEDNIEKHVVKVEIVKSDILEPAFS
jgi:isoleucyl-tRNA synthetase